MFKFIRDLFAPKPPMVKHAKAIADGGNDGVVILIPGGPPNTLLLKDEETIPFDRPACSGFRPDSLVRSREVMCAEVEKAVIQFKRALDGREPTVLVVNNWAVREIATWADEGRNPDGSWSLMELFGLKLVISIHVKEHPGFIVVG